MIALLSSCTDLPTVPTAFVHPAGGDDWVAMTVPPGLPELQTWLPYVSGEVDVESTGLQQIQLLHVQAEEARREGAWDRGVLLDRKATSMAVASLARMPDARVLSQALYAMDLWCTKATAEVDLRRFPQLSASVSQVRALHGEAAGLLTQGDTAAAVALIAEAADRIRGHSPPAVAFRVLDRVEERLRWRAGDDPEMVRALRMLRGARQALGEGDYRRAWRRSVYALQLAEGRGVNVGTPEPWDGRN